MDPIDEELKKTVWDKAQTEDSFDNSKYRKDACGAWMIWDKYGDEDSIYGWEIDHIYPKSVLRKKNVSEKAIDDPRNLRALQRDNNRSKGDDYPNYVAAMTSDGNKNVRKERSLTVNQEKQKELISLYNLHND